MGIFNKNEMRPSIEPVTSEQVKASLRAAQKSGELSLVQIAETLEKSSAMVRSRLEAVSIALRGPSPGSEGLTPASPRGGIYVPMTACGQNLQGTLSLLEELEIHLGLVPQAPAIRVPNLTDSESSGG